MTVTGSPLGLMALPTNASPTPMAQKTLWKREQKDCKRQKTKTFAVKESPVYDKGAIGMESQKCGHLNKTSTVTTEQHHLIRQQG